MASPLVKPVYRGAAQTSSTVTNPNLYYTLGTDFVDTTLAIGYQSFVTETGATATQLYNMNGSPSLILNVFIGGALQESSLVSAYSTSTVTLAFTGTTTIYQNELVQLAYTGANSTATITIF